MTCEKAIRLVEKLADGEASPDEREEARGHLESCGECSAHFQFVRAIEAASEKIELPEPTESYWQRFPSKVLGRIEREDESGRKGFWQKLFPPSMFRLGALAATLTLVVAVGVIVYREDPRLLEPERSQMSETYELEQAPASPETPASDEKAVGLDDNVQRASEPAVESAPAAERVAPAAARARLQRDEPQRSPAESSSPPADGATLNELRSSESAAGAVALAGVADEDFQDAPAPAPFGRRSSQPARSLTDSPGESALAEESELAKESVSADSARQQPSQPSLQAVQDSSQKAGEARTAVLASAPDRCTEWRRYLAADHDEEASEAREARYQVTLCSLRSHSAEPNDDTRQQVLRDAAAFLAIESDTDRAEEIRLRVEPLRP